MPMSEENRSSDHRLPRTVVPRRYDLTFRPDLDQGSFTGREAIEVVLTEASREIECHAAELEITGATLRRAGGSGGGAGGSG
ncbi:MAG: hypothetical protein ACRDZ5_09175, partial [Acidimicrobiales bacterium]